MTREEFESALVVAPEPGRSGEAVFDLHGIPSAELPEFRYTAFCAWGDDRSAMEECWLAYLYSVESYWFD